MRLFYSLFFALLASGAHAQKTAADKGLKDYYSDYFPIGVSVGPFNLQGHDSALIVTEFNSVSAENVMKMGPIHPEEDRYNWTFADQVVDFARRHDLIIRGHALCWHNQAGEWLFENEAGETASKELLLKRLKEHIFTVAGRYKDDIYAWDVVNEAISDSPNEFLRPSRWFEICGEEFISKAFEYAHEADPDALLFYNDYNAIHPGKRDKIIKLVRQLKERGIPINGIGIQAHWAVFGPSEKELREALDAYAELGLQIQITELDVSIYPPESGRRAKKEGESDEFTAELEQKQLEHYRMIFRVLREYKDLITGVTFWNVSDQRSWLDNFPVRGRKNYPLLFDENRKRKKAYQEVIDF